MGRLVKMEEKMAYKINTLKTIWLETLLLNGEIDREKEYFTISGENSLWYIWMPNSMDSLLPIRNYRFLKEPFPRNPEICENWKFCGRLKIINKACKDWEKYYALIAEQCKNWYFT